MLQTRLENEQFNLKTNVFPNTKSPNSFISTDRPDSSQLVDLHIYILPKSVWRNIQHLVQNEAMDDAVSAGFVRVSPDMKLYNLRQSIEKLCAAENSFPRDFIFLRSVGRCLTRVKPAQEIELKVKNYRPPQTYAPEIYLVEGRHEDYVYVSSDSPILSSANYLFGNRHQRRFNSTDYGRSLSKPVRTERTNLPIINTNNSKSPVSSSKRHSSTKLPQIDSDVECSSPSTKGLSKLKQEQERLRKRQAELEQMRLDAEEKKLQSEREKNPRQSRRQEKIQSEREESQHRRPEKVQPKRRRQEKIQVEHQEKVEPEQQEKKQIERQEEEEERRRHQRQEKIEKQETAATKIQASYRGFKDRQVFRERQRNVVKNNSRRSSTIRNEKKIDINDDELSDGSEILSRSSSIGSTSNDDSNSSRAETRTLTKTYTERRRSNSSSLLSMKSERKIASNISSYSKKKENTDDEDIRTATVTKIRYPEEELVHVLTPDINDEDHTYELERREAEIKRRRHLEDEKRKSTELEEQRQKKSSKQQQHEDSEALRIRLQNLRKSRIDLEKTRDETIGHLKSMHNRLTLRRQEARDMWKKKYFLEKKKTVPIEQQSTLSTSDVDKIYKKIEQIIDNEYKQTTQTDHSKDSEPENPMLQITRIRHEMQDIHRQIDYAKLRLTTDIKLRNQAENECQVLKHELNQSKMNCSQMKNRIVI